MLRVLLALLTLAPAALAAPPVTSLAYPPDGRQLAVGSREVVTLIDPATGATLRTLGSQDGRVTALAYSPAGALAAASGAPGQSGVVRLYEGDADANPVHVAAHKDVIHTLAFSPDGKTLATAGYDRVIKLWALPLTGASVPTATLTDHSDAVYALAFSPDGKLLASAGADRAVKLWDAATRQRLYTLSDATDWVYAVAWHPDGKTLYAAGADRSLRSWAVTAEGGKLTASVFAHEGAVTRILVGPKATPVVTVGEDRVAKVWDAATLREVKVVPAQADAILAAALSPDGKQFALGLYNGTIARLDAATGEPAKPAPAKPKPAADRFPLVAEAKPGQVVPLPASVAGTLDRPGGADRFRFTAPAGYELGVQLVTAAEPAKFAPVLTLTDAAGRVLAEREGTSLGVKLPAGGAYAVGVRDREFRGGTALAYRLHVGPIPVITDVFPLGVTRGVPTVVTLRGVNLGDAAKPFTVQADGPAGDRHDLKIPRVGGDPVGPATVAVGEFPSVLVRAGMDTPPPPFTLDGELAFPGAEQVVSFRAKKGERVVCEVEAARLGSALDSVLEVLDADGKPVPRATLRCTAKAYTTFRDNTSDSPTIRLEAWNELAVNDYLYVKGELMRIAALPKGPDDDCQFVAVEGKRLGHLGTTPTQQANGSLAYKVELHPPGRTFPPNGMPVFTLTYANDDGGNLYGKDSRVAFDPPADGIYRLRLRDANRSGGPNHAYRLTVRPPRPDFKLRVTASANVWQGGGIPVVVTATRLDDFDGPIRVTAKNLPAGYSIPDTVVEAGQTTTVVPLNAAASAKSAPAGWRLVGSAEVAGQAVTRDAPGGKLTLADEPDLTTTSTAAVELRPGAETRFTVKVERHHGFAGRVPMDVRGLPHGVRVMNVGLNGILITEGQTEREVVLFAEPWVTPQERPVTVVARSERATGERRGKAPKDTEYAAPPLTLTVK